MPPVVLTLAWQGRGHLEWQVVQREFPSMKKMPFVRHAESGANAGGATLNNDLIPLSPRGHQQAQFIAERLPSYPRLILQSSFLRTQETAAPFCRRTGLVLQVHPLRVFE